MTWPWWPGMADRIAVMQAGEVVERGPTEALFRAMRHPYTRALFEASAHRAGARAPPRRRAGAGGADACATTALPRRSVRPAPEFRAVDRRQLDLRRGESVGLVGESGCGKSTLTRAILGLDPLQAGEIRLDGAPGRAGRGPPRCARGCRWCSRTPTAASTRATGSPAGGRAVPPADRRRGPTGATVAEALTEVGLARATPTSTSTSFPAASASASPSPAR
jgi:hypothetical protein